MMAKTLNKKQKQILNRHTEVQSVYQLPPGVMKQVEDISYFENIDSDTERYLNDNFLYHRAQGL